MDTGFGCGDGKRSSAHRRFQVQEVVGGADQAPFALHFPQSPQQELSKAPGVLDLPEHRFYHLFAQPVAAFPATLSEFAVHGLYGG